MHFTTEQAVEYFEDEHMIADVEKDIVYGLQSEEEHYYYHYDTTRSNLSLSQYVRYTYDDDQNNIVDGMYVDFSESRGIRAFMNVVILIINNGKPDYVNKTVNYTLLDEMRANEELFDLTNGISSMFKSAKVSVSDDNLPTKIDFELDENMFKGMFPGGFDEAEASLKLSDFGNVTLTPPEGDVRCPSSHGCQVENYGYNSQYHWLYCSECGAFSTPEVEHTFDATHQVCTTCGYVKGVSPLMNDFKYANQIGDFYHAFKYKESAKGEAYNVELFYSQTQPGDGDNFKIGNVNYVTRPALQALITYANYEGDYLASGKCTKLLSTTYKLYLNIDAGYNGVEYVVGGVPLPDYLASVTPDATLVGYRAELAHTNGGHNESDSNCFRCSYDLCSRDARLQYIQCEHHHDNIVDLEKVYYPFGLFGQRVNNINMMEDNLICLKGKCADCEKEVYVVTAKYAASYHNISTGGGNLTPVPCYVLFKEGVRTVIYSTSDLEIGHIYDNHTCVLCGDGARELIDTDVVFSYKLNEEGDAIISYDFLVTSMGEHVNIMNGVGGYEMAGGDSPLGPGLVRETGYYTPEGGAREVIFYCDHTNSDEITYMKISCGINTVFTFGSLE